MLFICLHIFEQHNYVTMCDYMISLNKFNNITHSMIFSLQILHLSGNRHFQCRMPPLYSKYHFSSPVFDIFMSQTTYKYDLLQPVSQCLYFLKIHSTCPMSRSQVVFRRRFVCDEIMYYTITCSLVYPANVLGQFRRGYLLKSGMSSGDLVSSCRGRLSIGIYKATRPGYSIGLTSHVESDCITQDHHICDSSQIFSGSPFRCTCLFQAANLFGPIIL